MTLFPKIIVVTIICPTGFRDGKYLSVATQLNIIGSMFWMSGTHTPPTQTDVMALEIDQAASTVLHRFSMPFSGWKDYPYIISDSANQDHTCALSIELL